MCSTEYSPVSSSHIGGAHTVFISKSGFLLGCGDKHVLGLQYRSNGKHKKAQTAQREITSLSLYERALMVACGDSYTAVLTGKLSTMVL